MFLEPWTLRKVSQERRACGRVPPIKKRTKKWRMGREPLSAIIGGANRKFSFTYYLYALCCHGNTIHSILAVTLATTGLLYHLDQDSEYHHERHLVLFALLDWFLIPDPSPSCIVTNTECF